MIFFLYLIVCFHYLSKFYFAYCELMDLIFENIFCYLNKKIILSFAYLQLVFIFSFIYF